MGAHVFCMRGNRTSTTPRLHWLQCVSLKRAFGGRPPIAAVLTSGEEPRRRRGDSPAAGRACRFGYEVRVNLDNASAGPGCVEGNSPVDNGEAGLDGFASHADIHASRKLSFSHALCEQVTASVTTDHLTACDVSCALALRD